VILLSLAGADIHSQQAKAKTQWCIVDAANQCHGSSSSSSSPAGLPPSLTVNVPQDQQYEDRQPGLQDRQQALASKDHASALTAAAAFSSASATASRAAPSTERLAAAASRSEQVSCPLVPTVVSAYPAVVEALNNCQWPCFVLSTWPYNITHAALAAGGIRPATSAGAAAAAAVTAARHFKIIQGSSLEECVQQLVQHLQCNLQQPAQQQQQQQQLQQLLIVSSPIKAAVTQQHLAVAWPAAASQQMLGGQQQQQLQNCAAPAQLATPQQHREIEQQLLAKQWQQQHALVVQVGEWACPAPSLKAKALAAFPQLGLLSELAMAEQLGVSNVDSVMDGFVWR
jgi:hypothetical protein